MISNKKIGLATLLVSLFLLAAGCTSNNDNSASSSVTSTTGALSSTEVVASTSTSTGPTTSTSTSTSTDSTTSTTSSTTSSTTTSLSSTSSEPVIVDAESVTISGLDVVNIGETIELTASILPEDTTDKTVTWTSSDENVALVDEFGVVTGVSVGDTTIKAVVGQVEDTFLVTVLAIDDNLFNATVWTNGGEPESNTARSGELFEWHNQWGWVGNNNVISSSSVSEDGFKLTWEQEGGERIWFAQQIFYHVVTQVANDQYLITFNINSEEAGAITVNGVVHELVAGDNFITSTKTIAGEAAALSIQFGVEGGAIMESGSVVLSNITVKKTN